MVKFACVPQRLVLISFSPSGSASVNSSAVAELALGGVVLLFTSRWICTRCAAGVLRSCGLELRLRPSHSSSVVGVIGREWRCGDVVAKAGGKAGSVREGTRPGQRLRTLVALAGGPRWCRHDAAAERRCITDERCWAGDVDVDVEGAQARGLCICLLSAGLDASRVAARKKFGSSANSSLP